MRLRLWRTRCDGPLWKTFADSEAGNALAYGADQDALRSFAARNYTRGAMSTMTRAGGRCLPRECTRVGVSARAGLIRESSARADVADDELEVAQP